MDRKLEIPGVEVTVPCVGTDSMMCPPVTWGVLVPLEEVNVIVESF